MPNRRSSVAVIAIVALVTVTTVVMGLLAAANYHAYRDRERSRLRRGLVLQADQLAVALALPVWNIDRAQIDRVLDALEHNREVAAIEVQAAGKTHARTRGEDGRLVAAQGANADAGLLEEDRPITIARERIGTLKIYATPRGLEQDLRTTLTSIVASIVAVDLLLVLSVYLVLWRAVLKPLVDVERYAGAVTAGEPASPPPRHARAFARELESLRSSIEGMVALLDTRYQELRASEERYRLLFEGNPVPMLVYDLETLRFLAANLSALDQYGYEAAELLRLGLPDVAVPDDEKLREFLAERFDPRPPVAHVGRRQQRRRDGTLFDIDLTTLAIVFDGRPARLMLVRDVTSELRAQAEQERLQESLRRSETMAAMGTLLAGVAHEVRNPLFSISATVDALEGDFADRPDFAEYGELLRSQVARLTRLMRDLLDYGKPSTLSLADVQPAEPVRRAIRSCSRLAHSRGVELSEDVSAGLPPLALDTARMEQVLENLLANAVQHSPRGARVKLVARLTEPGPNAAVAFQIEDEGPGIAVGDLSRLFEPFFSRRKGGTGLGLPIVRRIVEAHGGEVWAANRAQGGAVFTVTMPVPTAATMANPAPGTPEPGAEGRTMGRGL